MSQQANIDVNINGQAANRTYQDLLTRAARLNKELKGLVPGTQAFIDKSKQLGDVRGQLTQITQEVNKTKNAMLQMSANTERMSDMLKVGLASAVAFVSYQVGRFIGGSVQGFNDQAQAVAQVEAGLRSTGNAAGFTVDELVKMSDKLERSTLFEGDEILKKSTAQLLSFTTIAGEEFERAQVAALNLATRLDGDLQSATIMIGKALNDPVKGLTAMGKAGIQFTNEQKAVIKSLAETGQQAEAQRLILAELEVQYGGSAEAAAKVGTGPLQQLGHRFEAIKDRVGELIISLVNGFRPALDGALNILEKMVIGVVALVNGLRQLPQFLEENKVAIIGLGTGMLLFNAQLIAASANSLRLAIVEKGRLIITNAVTVAQNLLNAAMTANPIGLVLRGIGLLVVALGLAYQKSQTLRAGVAGVWSVLKEFATLVVETFSNLSGGLKKVLSGDITGGLAQMGKAIIRANPITLAVLEGKRLGDAFNKGFNEKISDENAKKAASEAAKIQAEAAGSAPVSGSAVVAGGGGGGASGKAKKVAEESATPMIDALLGDMEQYEEARAAMQQLVDETLEAEMSAILAVQEAQNEADRQYQESRAVLAEEIRRASMTEQEREIEDLELFYAKRIEMAKFYGLDVVALEADFEEKKNEIKNRSRDQEVRIAQERAGILGESAAAFADFLDTDEKARRKHADVIKAFEIGRVFTNLYAELSGIYKSWADLPVLGQVFAGIQAATATVRAVSATRRIASQRFDEGGYTGSGAGPKDKSGYRVAGVVHQDEWVAPKWMNESPATAPIIAAMERIRQRGYADGGYTNPSTSPTMAVTESISTATNAQAMQRTLEAIAAGVAMFPRQIQAAVVFQDIEQAGDQLNMVRDRAAL